jgi:hypothetical protein
MRGRSGRLLRAVVVTSAVLGAAACGDDENLPAKTDGSAGSGGTGGQRDAGGDAPDARSPTTAGDCDFPSQFECECPCPDGRCVCLPGDESVIGCRCNEERPRGPQECVKTADFHCADWQSPPSLCECRAGSPGSSAECPPPARWECFSFELPMGCECATPP